MSINNNSKKADMDIYKALFEDLPVGFALCEIICDEQNIPIDYRFLNANPAFEKISGLKVSETMGKTIKDIYPDVEQSWIDFYGAVAINQKQDEIENYNHNTKKYYNVKSSSPEKGKFTMLFSDITIRKQAEENLKESEELWRSLTEHSPDYIWTCDLSYKLIFVNKVSPGFKRENLIGSSLYDYIPKEFRNNVKKCYKNILKTKQGSSYITSWTDPNGNSLTFEVQVSPMLKNNEIYGFVSRSYDITEQKQFESELFAQKTFADSIMTAAKDTIYVFDPNDGRPIYWNQANLDILGYNDEEMRIQLAGTEDFYKAEDLDKISLAIQTCVETGQSSVQVEARSKAGDYIPFEYSTSLMKDGNICVVGRDLREIREATKKLQATKKLLSETEKIGKIGGWTVDLKTMTQTWTAETYRIHELDKDFLPDVENGLSFYAPSSRPIIERAFINTIETGEPFDLELEIITAKGNSRWVHTVGRAQQKNKITHKVFGSFQDISKRKKAEFALKENQDRFQLIAEISSDIIWEWDIINGHHNWFGDIDTELGYKRDEFPRTIEAFESIIHPDDRVRVMENLRKHLEENASWHEEYRIITKNGDIKHWAGWGESKRDDSGKPFRMIGVVKNITGRKQAEYELIESEKKFRLLFENMTSGFVLFEAVMGNDNHPLDLIIKAANKGFEKTTGLNMAEVINKKLTKVLPGIENDDANWIGKYGKIATLGGSLQFDEASKLLDKCYTVTAYQPRQGFCAVLFFDITARIWAEKELAKTQKLLSETEKTAKIGGWVVDLETKKQTWTDETYNIHEVELSYEPDVSKGISFYAPSSRPIIEQALNNTIETGEPFDLEVEFITAKGNRRWVHSVGHAHQAKGVTTSVSGFLQDITARKLAEDEIGKAYSLLNSVINSPKNIIIFALDNNYNYLSFNNAHKIEMKALYNATIKKGNNILDYLPNETDRHKAEINYKRALRGEHFIETQEYGLSDNRVWYELVFNPIIGDKNTVEGFTVFVTNVSERKLADEELIEHRAKLEEMVQERTKDLKDKNTELDEAMKVFVGRELKIRDLQNKLNVLKDKF